MRTVTLYRAVPTPSNDAGAHLLEALAENHIPDLSARDAWEIINKLARVDKRNADLTARHLNEHAHRLGLTVPANANKAAVRAAIVDATTTQTLRAHRHSANALCALDADTLASGGHPWDRVVRVWPLAHRL